MKPILWLVAAGLAAGLVTAGFAESDFAESGFAETRFAETSPAGAKSVSRHGEALRRGDGPPPQASACTTGIVDLREGSACGTRVRTGSGRWARAYLGLPFGESTAGEGRWRSPHPAEHWDGVREAIASGPLCPQEAVGFLAQSEDCLTVNVWTPDGEARTDRPMMVFLFGGGYLFGSNATRLYDGSALAADHDVVVAVVNYRVGALGFLAVGDGEERRSNFGLEDQQLALRWLRANAQSFGADPDRLTLWGESAGAASALLHAIGPPESAALFESLILQSLPLSLPLRTIDEARGLEERLAKQLGCDSGDLECLRSRSAPAVVQAQQSLSPVPGSAFYGLAGMLSWAPRIDGRLVPRQPATALAEGALSHPTLLGWNRSEATLFMQMGKVASEKNRFTGFSYRGFLELLFRGTGHRRKVARQYPPERDSTRVLESFITDYLFVCASRAVARGNEAATWLYDFRHVPSYNVWSEVEACSDVSCHGDELSFVFQSGRLAGYAPEPEEEDLARRMGSLWARFAHRGAPAPDDVWPPWGGEESTVLVLDTEPIRLVPTRSLDERCTLWDEVGYALESPIRRLRGD